MVEWTDAATHDPDTFDPVLQARVKGKNVSVYISREAMDDGGLDACKRIAERKIAAGMVEDEPPKKVTVTTADL